MNNYAVIKIESDDISSKNHFEFVLKKVTLALQRICDTVSNE